MDRGIFRALTCAFAVALIATGIQTAASAAPATGTAAGHVFDYTGEPVAGAKVSVYVRSSSTESTRSTTTAADGSWSINDVVLGSNFLWVNPPTDVYAIHSDIPIDPITATSPHFERDLTLDPGAEIVGTVKDENGAPLAGIDLGTFYRVAAEIPNSQIVSGKTDASGAYRMTNVPVHTSMYMYASDPSLAADTRYNGNVPHPYDAEDLQLTAGQATSQDFVLPPRGHITGKVTDMYGAPVEGIHVLQRSARGPLGWAPRASAKTKADGTYEFAATTGDDVVLEFSDLTRNSYVTQYDDGALSLQAARQHQLAPSQTITVNQQFTQKARVYVKTPGSNEQFAFTITGDPKVGASLTVTPTYPWVPSTTTMSVQWLRNGTPIPGATSNSYVLDGEDFGHKVSARITGKADGWNDRTYTSKATSIDNDGGPLDVTGAQLKSTYYFGEYVRASFTGSATGFREDYAWRRDGKTISGVTAHKIERADIGHKISGGVTLVKPGYLIKQFDLNEATIQQARSQWGTAKVSAASGRRVWFNLALKSETVSPLWLDGTVLVQEIRSGKRVTLGTFAIRDGRANVTIGKRSAGLHTYYVRYMGVSGLITPVEISVRALL